MRFLFFASLIVTLLATGFVAMSLQGTSFNWPRPQSLPEQSPSKQDTPPPVGAPAAPPKLETACAKSGGENLTGGPAKPLRILTEGAYPPFSYVTAEGALAGFDVDIARALCREAGLACQIERQAWENLLDQISGGCADLVVASMLIPTRPPGPPGPSGPSGSSGQTGAARSVHPATAGAAIAYTQAYYKTPARFAMRKQQPALEWTREDLGGARIAVQAGSTHEAFLAEHFPGAQVQRLATLSQAQAALQNGKADALFADALALTLWTAGRGGTEDGGACCRLAGEEYDDPAFFGHGAGMALRAEDKKLLVRLNTALAAIRADGTYQVLATRHFGAPVN